MNYLLVHGRYVVWKKIAEGSFGEIYVGIDKHSEPHNPNKTVAIKLEHQNNPSHLLKFEANVCRYLYQPNKGIPQIHWSGSQDEYYVMVIEMLGPNFENLFDLCDRKFSLKTTLMIAQEIVKRIHYVHSRRIIHRDIKPENFLIGVDSNDIYIIDFGLCKAYKDKAGVHIPESNKKNLVGTIRYASLNSHKGLELSRRDDLESIGYMLIYFLKGSLPWQGLGDKKMTKEEKYNLIYECKKNTTIEKLCQGLPKEFKQYMDHVKSLAFDEKPNYNYLYNLFTQLFMKHKFTYDGKYDWVGLKKNF